MQRVLYYPSPHKPTEKGLRELLKDRLTVSSSVWETRRWLPDSHLSTDEKGGNELNFQGFQGKDACSEENSIWMLPRWRELTSDYFCQEHKTFLPLASNPSFSTASRAASEEGGGERDEEVGGDWGENQPMTVSVFPSTTPTKASQVALVVESACQCRRHKRRRFDPWVGKNVWRRIRETNSSIPAWKIPWPEKPGPMGSQRVRQD